MADVKNRRLNPGYSSYTDQLFLSQLTAEDFAMFQEQLYKFSGFSIQRRSIRQYNYPVAGHLFGDLGEVSKNDIAKDDYYVRGDFIGKQGIESYYEKLLRGEKGKEVLLRDAYGRIKVIGQKHYFFVHSGSPPDVMVLPMNDGNMFFALLSTIQYLVVNR